MTQDRTNDIDFLKTVTEAHSLLDSESKPPFTQGLCLPFPIRADFDAQLIIPVDMTHAEASRLSAFVFTLAAPDGKHCVHGINIVNGRCLLCTPKASVQK